MALAETQNSANAASTRKNGFGCEIEIWRSNSTGIKISPFLAHCLGRMARTRPVITEGIERGVVIETFFTSANLSPYTSGTINHRIETIIPDSGCASATSRNILTPMAAKQRLDILLV